MSSTRTREQTPRVWSASLTSLDLGDLTVAFLPDGVHHVEAPTHYPDAPEGIWDEHPEVIDDDGLLVMSVGAFLIRTGEHNVLVDLGFGPNKVDVTALTNGQFRGDLIGGALLESLSAVGVEPADVHGIVFSHLHLDHVGWVINPDRPDEPTFPNARYFMGTAELDYWSTETDPAERVKGATDDQIAMMRRSLELVDSETEIFPGVVVVPTPGHTWGHVSVLASGTDGKALVIGDALHCPVELQHHGMSFVFDQDSAMAHESRAKINEILQGDNVYFAGGHFPDRVFGTLDAGDDSHVHGLVYVEH